MAFNWSIERAATLLDGLTIIAMPSFAIIVPTGFTPFCLAVSISFDLMDLEASPISQELSIIPDMPTPDPPPETDMSASLFIFMYSSAAFWAIGRTVVEPWSASLLADFCAHGKFHPKAGTVRTAASARTAAALVKFFILPSWFNQFLFLYPGTLYYNIPFFTISMQSAK